jgi:EAL domain-containing protein (putative c-di-GMP-specific phosphodiesterase class I)
LPKDLTREIRLASERLNARTRLGTRFICFTSPSRLPEGSGARDTSGLASERLNACERFGIKPVQLELELTESALADASVLPLLRRLRNHGFTLALDDFGTGYSSLTQLHSLPLDYIKLDQSFITAIGGDDESNILQSDHMIRAILSIASTFDLKPIVEGVETAFQYERLQQNGGSLMQGYLFTKPLPLEEARLFISNYNNMTT